MTARADVQALAFSVDTHLFRELGKLLVGRDSTALVELIKNAYDADATHVVLHAERLNSSDGVIRVSDDGSGMSFADFDEKFLRIAGRSKEGMDRRSDRYRRRFTGAKGIGRLSAYKLAERLHVNSQTRGGGVDAILDWSALENSTGDVQDSKLVTARELTSRPTSGTEMEMTGLRLDLTKGRQARFLREMRATRPDDAFFKPDLSKTLGVELMIPRISLSDSSPEDPGFAIEFSGDLDPGDQPWPTLLASIDWIIEIDARATEVVYCISPSNRVLKTSKNAASRQFVHTRETRGAEFAARILVRVGGRRDKLPDLIDRFVRDVAGIRLYMEGFRVLPYGLPGNDWLEIDRDAVRRRSLELDDSLLPEVSAADERTYQLSSQNYLGAVFLTEENSAGLEMVVNREGFLPSSALDDIVSTVRRGIDLSVRVRAAIGAEERDRKKEDEKAKNEDLVRKYSTFNDSEPPGSSAFSDSATIERSSGDRERDRSSELAGLFDAAKVAASSMRLSLPAASKESADVVSVALAEARGVVEDFREERSQLRVLASVGTQFGAFIHEVNSLLAQARIVLELIDNWIEVTPDPSEARRRGRRARVAMRDLVAALERQAIYLTDSIGAEARKRRSRQRLYDRVETALRLLRPAAATRGVRVENKVSRELRSGAMFPAEVNIVMTNLLSNAIKAAGRDGHVVVSADNSVDGVVVRIENTGVAVDLNESERWFRPFETTTTAVDDVLGQGMGLGLPLSRRILEEYGGAIEFVRPTRGFASAVLTLFPKRTS